MPSAMNTAMQHKKQRVGPVFCDNQDRIVKGIQPKSKVAAAPSEILTNVDEYKIFRLNFYPQESVGLKHQTICSQLTLRASISQQHVT